MEALEVLSVKRNPKNGFAVVYKEIGMPDRLVLHYSADPDKDPATPEGRRWRDETRRGMDGPKWNREYEGDPYSHVGKACCPDYNWRIHETHLEPVKGQPLYRGWDPSYANSACVWLQIIDDDKDDLPRVLLLAEMESKRADFGILVERADKFTKEHFPGFAGMIHDDIDVASKTHDAAAKGDTCLKILGTHGINARNRKSKPEDRLDIINFLLVNETKKGKPCFQLDPRHCNHIKLALMGLYRRKENSSQIDKTEVVDLMDAMGYSIENNLRLRYQHMKRQHKSRPDPMQVNIRKRMVGPTSGAGQPSSYMEA